MRCEACRGWESVWGYRVVRERLGKKNVDETEKKTKRRKKAREIEQDSEEMKDE
jgi:hypothetical protein